MSVPRFPVYLFDIDGTLLDSAADICGAVQQVILETPVSPSREISFTYLKSFIGFHLHECFAEVFPDFTEDQRNQLIQKYRSTYIGRGHQATKPYPGVLEGLERLGGLKSTATTKGGETTRSVLEKFGLIRFFDHVQGTDGFPHKPAPDVIQHALKGLAADPGDCLMIGDSTADMEAARNAGVKVAAVTYGYGKREDLARWSPDYWISDLRELSAS